MHRLFCFLMTTLLVTSAHASRTELKIYCSALLSTTLRRAPVTSLQNAEVRKAVFVLASFARAHLPAEDRIVEPDEDHLMITSQDDEAKLKRRAARRLRHLLEDFGTAAGTEFIAADVHGARPCSTYIADIGLNEDALLSTFRPNGANQVGGPGASEIWKFFVLDGLERPSNRAPRWMFTSDRYALRPSTLRALLLYRRLDAELVTHELTTDLAVANDSWLKKVGRMSTAIRTGQGIDAYWRYLYAEREIWVDRLFAFNADGEPSVTVLIRVRKAQDFSPRIMRPARTPAPNELPLSIGI